MLTEISKMQHRSRRRGGGRHFIVFRKGRIGAASEQARVAIGRKTEFGAARKAGGKRTAETHRQGIMT